MVNDEISLKDMVIFLKRNQRTIIFFGMVGLLLSVAYLVLTPKKYEARWQMQMALFVNGNDNSNYSSTYNIEEPAALIQRLSSPTAYPGEVQHSCNVPENGGNYLGGVLEIKAFKNVVNGVEMKAIAISPDQAKRCADSLVAMIVAQQRSLIEDRLAGRQALMKEIQQVLQREQFSIEKLAQKKISSFEHYAKLSRINPLLMRIDALQEEILMSQKYPTKLLSPIYVTNTPVSPKNSLVMLFGLALSLVLGVIFALFRDKN